MAQDIAASDIKRKQHLEVSISSYYHHCHRPTTMTTTHQDNDHEDQDDEMRQEDITPPSELSWN